MENLRGFVLKAWRAQKIPQVPHSVLKKLVFSSPNYVTTENLIIPALQVRHCLQLHLLGERK